MTPESLIEECLAGGPPTSEQSLVVPVATPLWRRAVPWMAVPLMAMLAWWVRADMPVPQEPVSRWEIPAPNDETLAHWFRQGVAFSPDGTRIAFVSNKEVSSPYDRRGKQRIYIRELDGWTLVPLEVDGHLLQPFFSPDGKWLGTLWVRARGTRSKLMKFPLDGGSSTSICDCDADFGASWGSDDTIVFAEGSSGLWRVPAAGGEPKQITELDSEAGERSHRLPHVLPGGRAVLFTVLRHQTSAIDWSKAEIVVLSLETGQRKVLIKGGSDARYAPSGHLIYAREGTLMAVPFELASLSLVGPQVPVLEGVGHAAFIAAGSLDTGAAQFAFSSSGSLAYISEPSAPEPQRQPVWVDRTGREEPIDIEPASYWGGRLSPDQTGKLALWTWHRVPKVWLYDLERGTRSLETLQGFNTNPTWIPDGSGLAFASNQEGPTNVFLKPFGTRSGAERLFPSLFSQYPANFSPSGKQLAFTQHEPGKPGDIWIGSIESRTAEPFVNTQFQEKHPAFSPDGRWLAYTSNETGREQVYVKPYPGPGDREIISPDGGYAPAWSGDGRELSYRAGRKMMAVPISPDQRGLNPGRPVLLFEGDYTGLQPIRSYDVTPNGQRFLMISREPVQNRTTEVYGRKLSIVLNWFEELERLAPTNK